MACRLCGYDYRDYEKVGGSCPRCWRKYQEFCKNLPKGWQKLMGPSYSISGVTPQFYEWAEEQRIKKQRDDGTISVAEASRQANELAEKIRKKYNPTEEESRATAERLRAQSEVANDTPSLFD